MTMNLTQKERMLLEDQKSHEQLCIKKYNDYANRAQDAQLKQLFSQYAAKEQEHFNSINQMLNGQIPQVGQQQGQQSQQSQQQGQQGQQNQQSQMGMQSGGQSSQQGMSQGGGQNAGFFSQSDADLCHDMLVVEKYISGAYDTSIFEMRDKGVRNVLNHIQKEEQQHGEGLYSYMSSHGIYSAK